MPYKQFQQEHMQYASLIPAAVTKDIPDAPNSLQFQEHMKIMRPQADERCKEEGRPCP